MSSQELLELFSNGTTNVDETAFSFKTDKAETEHFIGYLPEYNLPYWIGKCDIPDGCEFKTAIEMFEAPVFNGQSIKDRWNEIVLFQIGGLPVEKWKA